MIKLAAKIRQKFFICLFIIILLPFVYSQEEVSFSSYEVLKPSLNILKSDDSKYNDNLLFCMQPLGGINAEKKILVFNPNNATTRVLSRQDLNLNPSSIQNSFFDPISKSNYVYLSNYNQKNNYSDGWYKLEITPDYQIELFPETNNKYWANSSSPIQIISKDKLLLSEYSKIDALQMISKFQIIDNKKTVWNLEQKGQLFSDMYLISNDWLLNVTTPHIAGIWNNKVIFNYKTGERISFEPEQIIGYGNGVVITSLKTSIGFTGVSIWSDKKELLYRDSSFPITKMIKNRYPETSAGVPIIYMSYFSYPFVYCDLGRVSGIGIPFCTLVLNLISGKTFFSPETYNLLAVF